MIKRIQYASLIACHAIGCGADAASSTEELGEAEPAALEQALLVDSFELIELTESLDSTRVGAEGAVGEVTPEQDSQSQSRCSPAKQEACDQCMSSCDELCPLSDDGELPTKCKACQRACTKTCSKCGTSAF